MPKVLTPQQVDDYREKGIVFPVRIFDSTEAAGFRRKLETLEASEGGRLNPQTNSRPHILMPWLDRIVRNERLLDAVEDILGPNLLCWGSQFFTKNPGDASYVSWHQDATYWGLSSPDVVTAWIAFSPSNRTNGCMRVVPGTHREQVAHRDHEDGANMLSRGQEIAVEVDEAQTVDVELEPGEISLHNVLLFHGSNANTGADRRIGYAVRFIPTHVRQIVGHKDSATLVRGVDTYGHFNLLPSPEADFHPDALRRHQKVIEDRKKYMFA